MPNNKLAEKPLNINENWVLKSKIRKSVTRAEEVLVKELSITTARAVDHELVLRILLANLWFASLHDNQLLTPVNRTNKKVDKVRAAKLYRLNKKKEGKTKYSKGKSFARTRPYARSVANKLLDKLAKAGYVKQLKGTANSFERVATWSVATNKLLNLIAQYEDVSICTNSDEELLILRDDKKEPLKIIKKHEKKATELAKPASLMNNLIEADSVSIYIKDKDKKIRKPLYPILHRVFNKAKDLSLGGRFYGSHCNKPQTERRTILIGDESTCEVDYSAIHPAILYAEAGMPMLDDPYTFHEDRNLCKSLMLRLINCNTVGGFKSSVTKSGNPETKKILRRYVEEKSKKLLPTELLNEYIPEVISDRKYNNKQFDVAYLNSLPYDVYAEKIKNVCKGFIIGVPDNMSGEVMYNNIVSRHKNIAHRFGVKDLGLYLQNKDSEIMSLVLTKLATQGIVALPVHDSVVVKKRHKDEAMRVMENSFEEVFPGFSIKVEEK